MMSKFDVRYKFQGYSSFFFWGCVINFYVQEIGFYGKNGMNEVKVIGEFVIVYVCIYIY